ncbi:hypothetical protein [Ornithinimicrobium sufpigmenti]|uniref:hypothetical protein n=1 Tax=Ornithinimicrobium sufpigmenti TaxID=2508882 RepID=UPI001035BBC3|nr:MULTISPECIES: hypothetical protein [unclassified Ornithinimicrobium]
MPHVDIAATRTAATEIAAAAEDARGRVDPARVATTAAGELSESVSQPLLHPLEGLLSLRLGQLAEELEAMSRGMDDLADHTEQATG